MIVTGPDIVRWVEQRMGGYGFDNPHGIGIIRNDRLVGGVVFDNYRPAAKTIYVSIAINDKIALSKQVLQSLFEFPFIALGCRRLMAMIETNNHPSMQLCRRLGFTQEGVLRQASPTGSDIAVFGMLRDECRWLTQNESQNNLDG